MDISNNYYVLLREDIIIIYVSGEFAGRKITIITMAYSLIITDLRQEAIRQVSKMPCLTILLIWNEGHSAPNCFFIVIYSVNPIYNYILVSSTLNSNLMV